MKPAISSLALAAAREEPQWFRNLRRADRAQAQLRADCFIVVVSIPGDPEQQRLWREVALAQAPSRARCEKKAGRRILVAVLTPP